MCGNLFGGSSSPKVEKVAPAPTPQTSTDTAATSSRMNEQDRRRRAAKGADWARNQSRDNVLTDNAQSGTRQTLG